MKKPLITIIIFLMLLFLLCVGLVTAEEQWSETWEFNYEENSIDESEIIPEPEPDLPSEEPIVEVEPSYEIQYDPQEVEWWNDDWSYARQVTIESDYIDATLTGFPVLVTIDSTTAAKCNSGNSLRFVNYTNETEFNYDIDEWNESGNSYVWVNVTTVDSGSDTFIHMYYGNAGASAGEDEAATWDNHYLGVFHMNESTGSTIYDSSGNNNHGSYNGTLPTHAQWGIVGHGQYLDGSDDYAEWFGDGGIHTDAVATESIFVKESNNDVSHYYYTDVKDTSNYHEMASYSNWNDINYNWKDGGAYHWDIVDDDSRTTNAANYVHAFDSAYATLYRNGTSVSETAGGTTGATFTGVKQRIGINQGGTGDFLGYMDEYRVSDINRSAAWIKAEYSSTLSAFSTLGDEQTNGSQGETFTNLFTLYFNGIANIQDPPVVFLPVETLYFNGIANIQSNVGPTLSYPNPANNSWEISKDTDYWNITIEDVNADDMTWTIEGSSDIGINGSSGCFNGSYSISISDNLSYGTKYTVWVNASDGILTTRGIYNFNTHNASTFSPISTLYFNGTADIQILRAPNVTINSTEGVEETNVTCVGYMKNTSGRTSTAWFQADDNIDFSSLRVNQSNGTIGEGEIFFANVTGFDNGTFYYIRTGVNNSIVGWNYSWNYSTVLTKPQPATSIDATVISGGFNITWTHGNGYNSSVLVMNQAHYPQHANDGQLLQNNKRDYYNHNNLNSTETYYYRIWEYVSWGAFEQFSDGNESMARTYSVQYPVFSNPNPANNSEDVNSDELTVWNITIESPMGKNFNWTIEGEADIGINGSDECQNGSYNITVTDNLTTLKNYTVWVNASETANQNWTNETFYFKTDEINLTIVDTLNFGGYANVQGNEPVLSSPVPSNTSFENKLYPWLNITVTEPQSQPMNVSWYYNIGDGWVYIGANTTTTGSTVRQRATWVNNSYTKYNWSVHVNDSEQYWTNATYFFYTANYSWGDWSPWWQFNFSCCCPTNFQASSYNETAINLTWDNCEADGCDTSVVVGNETGYAGYPYAPSNGTELYNGTNEAYNHTGLARDTSYYYTIWGYNETSNEYSVVNYTASVATQGDVTRCCPYPGNHSTGNAKPPINVSALINGTGLDIYFYFINMTPVTNTSTLFANWSSVDTGRYKFDSFNWTTPTIYDTTDWIWGETTYKWSVNISDGGTWYNWTFNYSTGGSRYDVTGSNDITGTDASRTWANRVGESAYNGIYDVNQGGDVTATDASLVWAHRTE